MKAIKTLRPGSSLVESEPESKNEQVLLRIAAFSTALGLGTLVASVQALRLDNTGFTFHASIGTFVAFAAGAIAGLLFWRIASKGAMIAKSASLVFAAAGVGLFLYPLRHAPAATLHELEIGLISTAIAITVMCVVLWQVKRSLDSDEQEAKLAENQPGVVSK